MPTPRVKLVKRVSNPPEDQPLLYTRQQVARMLNCSVMTVQRMQWDGRLPTFKLMPGAENARVYIKASDVHALIEKMTSASEAGDDAR